jgi:putative phage-type endonuclease
MPIIMHPKNRDEWLSWRAADITSTEISALFGHSPYNTELEVFHHKLNGTYGEIEDNDRMKWGRRLQDTIAAGIAEDMGWKIKPLTCYARHSRQRGMGSSFDYEVIYEDKTEGIMEVKAVDFVQHRDKWIEDGDDSEAPIHIEWQLQHQLEVFERPRGTIAALVSGNKPIVINRDRDEDMGGRFCERIEQFWRDIDRNNPPTPDFERDGALIRRLYATAKPKTVVLDTNNRAQHLCQEYTIAQQIESAGAKRKDAAVNELITLIGDAERAMVGEFKVSAGVTERAGYTVEPTTYRNIRVSKRKLVDK